MARTRSIASLPYKIVFGDWYNLFSRNYFIIRGFSPWNGERFFILGAKWWALVRGWRWDCVVGGMETRFQWRKAHSPSAKCEAFHVAPRLFFMFLFLITFTIRQQCIIYPHKFSTDPISASWRVDFRDNENGGCPFLVGKGEPPSLSSYFNFTFTCDLSIQRRREI